MDPADTVPVLRELSIQGEMLERHEKMMKHVVDEQTELRQLVAELKEILLTPPGAAAKALLPRPSLSTAAASPLLINAQSWEKRLPVSSRGDIDGCYRKHLAPPS